MGEPNQNLQDDSAIIPVLGPAPNHNPPTDASSPPPISLPPIGHLLASIPPSPTPAAGPVPSIEDASTAPVPAPELHPTDMARTVIRPSHGPGLLYPPDRSRAATSLSPSPSLSSTLSVCSFSAAASSGPRGSLSPPYVFSGASRNTTPGSSVALPYGSPPADEYDGSEDARQLEEQAAVEQAEEGSIVVDRDELRGTDAGYESDNGSSASTSLAESIRDYIYENGRRYHRFREGRYNFPNDDSEQQREDMKHSMVKMLCGNQLFFAPLGRNPQQILDIGTGTGIWAIEMGDLFESATVLGVDLSPIQPEWVPPNVRFMVDDVESPWLHPRNYFDYIHARHTVMAIKDWPRLMRRSLEHLKPGGWLEIQEVFHSPISVHGTMPPDHPVAQYWRFIHDGLTRLGVQFHAVANERMKHMMQECGYVNVQERVLHIPIGTWPKNKVLKTVGLYWRTILLDGVQAIALGPLTRGCGWSREQVELFLIQVRKGYHDNSCLAYMPLHIIFGQKPMREC
ncbi:hypothetical protein QBC47DRAFT_399513 [Echria macrotheca]|uniref:S-adenosyl-L-methionine-dependent methyltransferase n=1 Tax=Echria macrotheca TaxID=438768 RepID=A0AAJ0BMG3_9PEZI|nr:hypothetical protein QBC47DRAFT_399513 [Echria macrotheca]